MARKVNEKKGLIREMFSRKHLLSHIIAGCASATAAVAVTLLIIMLAIPHMSVPKRLPIKKVTSSLVKIQLHDKSGYGSGVVVQSDSTGSLVLTNKHVCKIADRTVVAVLLGMISEYGLLESKQINTQIKAKAQVVYVAQAMDLCLLKTDLKNLPAVKVAKNGISQGDLLFNVSNPVWTEGYVAEGRAGLTAYVRDMKYLQTSVPTYPGSSGSGVFNADGELVGLISLGRTGTVINYIVPTDHIKLFLKPYL